MPDPKKLRPSLTIDRRFLAEGAEIRLAPGADGKTKTITGYAAVFNAEAEIMPGFREIVRPGAFTRTLKTADVRALMNHDPNFVLGRNKAGTLDLAQDDKGLLYTIEPPDTSYANDLLVSIQRGDVTQSSFGFRVVKDRWTEDLAAKTVLRELLEVKLFDVSPVTYPAYAQTEVHVRGAMQSLLRKQEELSTLDDEERAGVLSALKMFTDLLTPDPALSVQAKGKGLEAIGNSPSPLAPRPSPAEGRHSGMATEDPAPSQDGRHSSGDDGRDPADLRMRLELLAIE